ncbi:MAG: hypothetical protein LAC69_02885 [Chlorobium sp.]|nr:hypothetical protein [Chlorobium sp.]
MVFRSQIKGSAFALTLLASLLIHGNIFAGTLIGTERECNIHQGPCSITSGSYNVTLNIDPKPVKHMKELTFRVTVTPCDKLPGILLLDLSMPGMEMGKNQVTLVRKSACIYEGKGIIVRCMSGRTLWRVTILSDELNNPAFTFNVRE